MTSTSAASSVSTDPTVRVPLLAGNTGGAAYAQWRPQMQTYLMRQGIEERDYTREIPQWRDLVAAVQDDAAAEEQDAIARLLAAQAHVKSAASTGAATLQKQTSASSSAATAMVAADPETVAAKKAVALLIGRSRKAFAILHSALPSELRPLVADVPQGYAFGVWSFLEKKYRNTEQDSVASLWADLTALTQQSDESFDEYKARIDSVVELLTHAKQSVPSGLYASLVLWRLHARYNQVVLALKTADRLMDTEKIDWRAVAETINQFERSQFGLGESESANDRAMAARTRPWLQQKSRSDGPGAAGAKERFHAVPRNAAYRCYNCNEPGHFKADCPQPKKKRHPQAVSGGAPQKREQWTDSSAAGASAGKPGPGRSPQGGRVAAATAPPAWLNADSSEDDEPRRTQSSAGAATAAAQPRARLNMMRRNDVDDRSRSEQGKEIPKALSKLEFGAVSYAAVVLAASSLKKEVTPTKGQLAAAAGPAPMQQAKKPQISLDAKLKSTAKAVDSAATVSTTCSRESLHGVRRCHPVPIKMADGSVLSAMYKGDLSMRLPVAGTDTFVKVTIRNVYYHERFDANLLSWGAMRRAGWEMHSTQRGTHLMTPGGKRVDASTRGDLTILEDVAGERVYGMGGVVCMTARELLQLHRRLGHASWDRLVTMCKSGQTVGVGDIRNMPTSEMAKAEKAIKGCAACAESKAHRAALGHRGLDKGEEAGAVLHMDTAYLIVRNPTTGKKTTQYCLSAKDSFSEWWWTNICPTMADVQQSVLEVIEHSRTLTGRYPRLIIADLGTEFNNHFVNDYCRHRGTQYQPSPARAKEMNGLAEKSVDTLKNHARAMVHAAGLGRAHHMYGPYAIRHFVYVWNRTHVGRRTGTTPHQAMTGREASVLNVGEFGCDVYLHQHRTTRDTTFDRKAEPGVYLGHDPRQNCARVIVVRSGKIASSRDVHFREGSYEHALAMLERRADEIKPIHLGELDAPVADGADDLAVQQPSPDEVLDVPDSVRVEAAAAEEDNAEDASARRYTLRSVTDSRVEGGEKQYRCKWSGYSGATWEPASVILEDAPEAVRKYESFVTARAAARTTRSLSREAASSSSNASAGPSMAGAQLDSEDDAEEESEARLAAAFAARRL